MQINVFEYHKNLVQLFPIYDFHIESKDWAYALCDNRNKNIHKHL